MLIDAPGISVCGDAQLLGQIADAAILVIEANSTRRLTARKAKESLDAAGVRLLGTVLNNRIFPIPEGIYRKL
jgi:Mrp family chromosome partitioning ATPase